MTRAEIQELSEEAKCFLCLGVTMAEALRLALLKRIADAADFRQLYTGADADPNAAMLVPADPSDAAAYYQYPSITPYNQWNWDVPTQTWVQWSAP